MDLKTVISVALGAIALVGTAFGLPKWVDTEYVEPTKAYCDTRIEHHELVAMDVFTDFAIMQLVEEYSRVKVRVDSGHGTTEDVRRLEEIRLKIDFYRKMQDAAKKIDS